MEKAEKVYEFGNRMEVDSKYGVFYLVKKDGVEYVAKVINEGKVIRWMEKTISDQLKFDHPNVVKIVEHFQTPHQWCLIYEYCSKGDLFDLVILKKGVPTAKMFKYFQDVLKGMSYLHELGYVHQDIKAENIFIHANDQAKIGDFDMMTRQIDHEGLCGTAHYIAPETILRQPRHAPVDLWALGVTIYSLLTGTRLFEDKDLKKLYQKILRGSVDYQRLCYTLSDLKAKETESLLKKLLRVNPDERISSKEALKHPLFAQNSQN